MYIVSRQNLIWGNEIDIWYYKMFKRKEEWSCKMDEKIEKVMERVKGKGIDRESNEKLKWKEFDQERLVNRYQEKVMNRVKERRKWSYKMGKQIKRESIRKSERKGE